MNWWKILRILLSLITVGLLYVIATEPPKTRAYKFNSSPEKDKNAVFYKKVFSKEQMKQFFIYKLETTSEKKAKAYDNAKAIRYIREEETGERYYVIFANELRGDFAKISPEPEPQT